MIYQYWIIIERLITFRIDETYNIISVISAPNCNYGIFTICTGKNNVIILTLYFLFTVSCFYPKCTAIQSNYYQPSYEFTNKNVEYKVIPGTKIYRFYSDDTGSKWMQLLIADLVKYLVNSYVNYKVHVLSYYSEKEGLLIVKTHYKIGKNWTLTIRKLITPFRCA